MKFVVGRERLLGGGGFFCSGSKRAGDDVWGALFAHVFFFALPKIFRFQLESGETPKENIDLFAEICEHCWFSVLSQPHGGLLE